MSENRRQTSDIRHLKLDIIEIRHLTWDLWDQTSDSDVCYQTYHMRRLTSDVRHHTYHTSYISHIWYHTHITHHVWRLKSVIWVSSGISALKQVIEFVSMHTAIKIYKGLIEPHFDYCSAVLDGLTQQLSEKLQKLQNCAVRVITKSSYDTSSRFLLNSLGWDKLLVRRAKRKANLMYKCNNNPSPAYLCLPQEHWITIVTMRRQN